MNIEKDLIKIAYSFIDKYILFETKSGNNNHILFKCLFISYYKFIKYPINSTSVFNAEEFNYNLDLCFDILKDILIEQSQNLFVNLNIPICQDTFEINFNDTLYHLLNLKNFYYIDYTYKTNKDLYFKTCDKIFFDNYSYLYINQNKLYNHFWNPVIGIQLYTNPENSNKLNLTKSDHQFSNKSLIYHLIIIKNKDILFNLLLEPLIEFYLPVQYFTTPENDIILYNMKNKIIGNPISQPEPNLIKIETSNLSEADIYKKIKTIIHPFYINNKIRNMDKYTILLLNLMETIVYNKSLLPNTFSFW